MARTPIYSGDRQNDPRFNRNAIIDRRQFLSELFDANGNPTRVMYEFCGRMQKEVGGQGPEAQMAFAESVFNRAAARNHTIDYEIRNHGRYSYWPQRQSQPGSSRNQAFIDIITKVCRNGTNLTCGATGNDGVGDGINTTAPTTYVSRGERYSIEHADRNWHANKFASLIRGVGRFIGDVAGAIGQGIAAVANGVVRAGAWVVNQIGSAFSPQQHTQQMPPRHQHMDRPGHQQAGYRHAPYQAGPYQPNAHQMDPRQPERIARVDTPPSSGWIVNGTSVVSHRQSEQPADVRPEPRPRP